MKRRLFAPLIVAALLLAFGTAASGCGGDGDGGLTLEEYFQRLEAAENDRAAQSEALQEESEQEFSEGFASEKEEIEATRDLFDAVTPVFGDFVDALADVDPPAEAQDAHEEAVDAGARLLAVFQDVADRLAEVESASEAEEVLDDSELETADDRFDQACFTLQEIADANDIVVDLGCPDEQG